MPANVVCRPTESLLTSAPSRPNRRTASSLGACACAGSVMSAKCTAATAARACRAVTKTLNRSRTQCGAIVRPMFDALPVTSVTLAGSVIGRSADWTGQAA